MKPFDLKKALAGEPVVLRDGHKAIVYYCVPDEIKLDDEGTPVSFPLKGMRFNQDGYLTNSSVEWRKDGRFRCSESDSDIIGMWEEPKIRAEDLPKPFKPKDSDEYFYINGGIIEYESEFWDSSDFDIKASKRGGCFRTREDAQKWLDFMKGMLE